MKFNLPRKYKKKNLLKQAINKLNNEKTVYNPQHPEVKFRTLVSDRFFITTQFSTEHTEPDYLLVQFDGQDVFEYSKNSKPKFTIFEDTTWELHL